MCVQPKETQYAGLWVIFFPNALSLYSSEIRSKDSLVYLWDIPNPLAEGFTETPWVSHLLEHVSKPGQGDLTSLEWNPEGTLLAIGSYNSILRVCTLEGSIYFTHNQHQVCLSSNSVRASHNLTLV